MGKERVGCLVVPSALRLPVGKWACRSRLHQVYVHVCQACVRVWAVHDHSSLQAINILLKVYKHNTIKVMVFQLISIRLD